MRRAAALISILIYAGLATPLSAKPSPGDELRPEVPDLSAGAPRPAGVLSLAIGASGDTVCYGGTRWAADSLRWEALRDSVWTFDTGVGSAFGPTGSNKPAGYHTLMEGWYGIDESLSALPWFRRSTTCKLNGSWSLWAGVTAGEANGLCYSAGQGYGNNWNLSVEKTFAYSGTGNATLSFKYSHEIENGFDFAYVLIDTSGAGLAEDIELVSYTGTSGGMLSESLGLVRGTTLRRTPGNVRIKLLVRSDGSYSDEDGLSPTTCGAFTIDDVSLTGALSDFTDFEAGLNGWALVDPATGVGDYTNIVNRSTDLPPAVTFCACGVQDSVLVFFDPIDQHPIDQENLAASPWIDLKRGGDVGRPGKLFIYDVYAELPLANYVFVWVRARWYPSTCPATGLVYQTPWRDNGGIQYFGEAPYCSQPGSRRVVNYSGVIGANAEQVQVACGVVNLCRTAPFGVPCSGVTNMTPWIDNVSFGVTGQTTAPIVTLSASDFLQDNFSSDGTLNPASTGRVDTNRVKNATGPGPNTVLSDTLVARGDGGNTEVRLVFRVRPGPFVLPSAIAAWTAKWTPEPSIGAGWYSARMDTAEQGGAKGSPLGWMSCFHESDPGFSGHDRAPDPVNPSQNLNDILPDNVLTPGSRIDYFVKSRYIPPDPRNLGGTSWYITPDTAGGRYAEVEILPSSTTADTSWSCVLYVDHHHDREPDQQALEEQGLTTSLGAGGTNPEGTKFDRWDVQTPSSGQLSFGRPILANYGASTIQAFGYKSMVWHSGSSLSSGQLTDEDANILRQWLTLRGVGNNRFWGSGDGLAQSMHASNEPTTTNFLVTVLGALRTCNTIREASCPTGSALDSTFCLPLLPVANSYFTSTFPMSVRGNGCPTLRSFDLLNRNTPVPGSRGQLAYQKNGETVNYASITNYNTIDVDYRTVLDGFSVGSLRGLSGNPHQPSSCTSTLPAIARTDNVLDWFGPPARCEVPPSTSVPEPEPPGAPKYRFRLWNAHPNPMTSTTRILFEVPGGEVVRLDVYDVTGRLVRKLADGAFAGGVREINWDGRDDSGHAVPAGLYFYSLTTGSRAVAGKLMVFR